MYSAINKDYRMQQITSYNIEHQFVQMEKRNDLCLFELTKAFDILILNNLLKSESHFHMLRSKNKKCKDYKIFSL